MQQTAAAYPAVIYFLSIYGLFVGGYMMINLLRKHPLNHPKNI